MEENEWLDERSQNDEHLTRQICDLSDKLETCESCISRPATWLGGDSTAKTEDKLTRVAKDASKTTIEAVHGLMALIIKDR